jgi:hypothetical protein
LRKKYPSQAEAQHTVRLGVENDTFPLADIAQADFELNDFGCKLMLWKKE